MMFGGRTGASFLENVGVFDDNTTTFADQAHLTGALERYFADTWGEEGSATKDGPEPEMELQPTAGNPSPRVQWGRGRVKATWSGVLGLSADFMPWVGSVPQSVSGRPSPSQGPNRDISSATLAPPGEWISAGYTGEGMSHAWLSGRALARMLLMVPDLDTALQTDAPNEGEGVHVPLPKPFLITEKRVKEAQIENLVDRIAG
jgi:glycine/D-amino acid oxidase-like deaminating enzyme